MANWMPPQFPSDAPSFEQGRGPLLPQAQQPSAPPTPSSDAELEGLPDEELQRLADLGVIDEELASNIMRQRQAQDAASMQSPEGRQVGQVFVAASPLEHMASAANRMMALRSKSKLEGEEKSLLDRKRGDYRQRIDYTMKGGAPFSF